MKRLCFAAALAAALLPSAGNAQTYQRYVAASEGVCRTSVFVNRELTNEAACTSVRVSRSNSSTNYSFGVGETRVVFIAGTRSAWNPARQRMELPVQGIALVRNGQAVDTWPVVAGWCEATDAQGRQSRRWLSCSAAMGTDGSLHGFYVSPTDLSAELLGGLQ
jgi:hypothetical protein